MLSLGDSAVPPEDNNTEVLSEKLSVETIYSLSNDEQTMVCLYRLLNKDEKKKLIEEARSLSRDSED